MGREPLKKPGKGEGAEGADSKGVLKTAGEGSLEQWGGLLWDVTTWGAEEAVGAASSQGLAM